MNFIDLTVIVIYFIGLLLIGFALSSKITSASEMFSAGGKSPWWISGISSYMTMFSAGTFVVWGGIAYRQGVVAITISMMFGVSAFIAGYLLAGKWKETNVSSAVEFIETKYGLPVVKMYTILLMLTRIIGVAVAIYSLAVLVTSLVPLEEGNIFRSSVTGNFSTNIAILIIGIVVVLYTFSGGLWAVMVTDVMQFIVLMVAVIYMVPSIISKAGGAANIINNLPEGHLNLLSSPYTFFFLVGWVIIHVFKIGGEWAFVQRHLCVKTQKDAKKAAYLFGVLYLITPILWMIPPIVFKAVNPSVNPEQAYILASQYALPTGMLGLVIAAMLSATASMADSELNVFAGALTSLYNSTRYNKLSEKELLNVGKIATIIIGAVIILTSLMIPYLGGAEKLIVSITSLFVGPMVLPTIWALFVKKVTPKHAYITVIVSGIASAVLKFCLKNYSFFADRMQIMDLIFGIAFPLLTLTILTFMYNPEKKTVVVKN